MTPSCILRSTVLEQAETETGSLFRPMEPEPEVAVRADQLLQTHTVWWGGTCLLSLDGELDIATAPLLDRAVTSILAAGPDLLCLGLTALAFCDVTGLHALHRLTDQTRAARTHLHLAGLHPRLRYTLARLETLSPWTPPVLQD